MKESFNATLEWEFEFVIVAWCTNARQWQLNNLLDIYQFWKVIAFENKKGMHLHWTFVFLMLVFFSNLLCAFLFLFSPIINHQCLNWEQQPKEPLKWLVDLKSYYIILEQSRRENIHLNYQYFFWNRLDYLQNFNAQNLVQIKNSFVCLKD